jgi:hypothetical protein
LSALWTVSMVLLLSRTLTTSPALT